MVVGVFWCLIVGFSDSCCCEFLGLRVCCSFCFACLFKAFWLVTLCFWVCGSVSFGLLPLGFVVVVRLCLVFVLCGRVIRSFAACLGCWLSGLWVVCLFQWVIVGFGLCGWLLGGDFSGFLGLVA